MVYHKNTAIHPNEERFYYFCYFLQERMNIFWNKCSGEDSFLTKDPILKKYKFTNVYRACDRVSQYLINTVIYKDLDLYTPQDVLLRILFFKIFNKVETWEYIEQNYGNITYDNFDVDYICKLLSQRQINYPIFNNAYMMSGSHRLYNEYPTKHEKWLNMVKSEFIKNRLIENILKASSLEEIYNILKKCSFIGEFLSYQYAIDFNYSPYVNFDENSFVKAGIGAIRGIKKCFDSYGESYEDAILYTYNHLYDYMYKYGFDKFKPLPGREPHLIDIQNCFCETDKYLREKIPELKVDNVRIKQKYNANNSQIIFKFPPKWNINEEIKTCMQKHILE